MYQKHLNHSNHGQLIKSKYRNLTMPNWYADGRVTLKVLVVEMHQMVVVE